MFIFTHHVQYIITTFIITRFALSSIFTPQQLTTNGKLFVRLNENQWPPKAVSPENPDLQPIGHNVLAKFPENLALILKHSKEEAVQYTGHCWRRAAATIAANNGASEQELLALGGWQSPRVVQRYIVDSDRRRLRTSELVSFVYSI